MSHRVRHPAPWSALAVLFLAACVTTTMRHVVREPDFEPTKIHHVLVVGIGRNPALRPILEKEFVKQWNARGVNVTASHTVMPPGAPLEKAQIAPIARSGGYDTVVVTRVLGTQNIDPQIKGEEFVPDPSTGSVQNLSEYMDAVVASPEHAEGYRMAAVTTRVYDVASEKRLWEGISQTLIAEDPAKLIPPYVKLILQTMYAPPKPAP